MSDSESDASNNVFTFQNVNTTVSAKGPNTNITNLSFRNQLTSTMYMPRNFERQRYAESAYDQKSMYYRRETSPMSIHSAYDIRPRNFQKYYPGSCVGSQQSVFNGRSGSPISMRSIDSTASAANIAYLLENVKFNKYDLKRIKEAYNKLIKQSFKKRRNMRLFLKRNRRTPSDDSEDLGDNSSISSDDCRSAKTSFKENMTSSRSARIDLTEFRKTNTDSNMLRDCIANFGQNTSKNMFSIGPGSVNNTQSFNNTLISKQSNPISTQKDRFRNGFLLPSQRFNRSVASSVILEISKKPHRNICNSTMNNVKNHYAQNKNTECASGSEEEQIFSEMTVRENSTYNIDSQHKRSFDEALMSEDDSSLPDKKRSKWLSPARNTQKNKRPPPKPKNDNPSNHNIDNLKNFEFVKPALPVRKSKQRVQEKLITKSSQPLTEFLEPVPSKIQENIQPLQLSNLQEKSSDHQNKLDQAETTQNSDVSMRPSFIKRKLYTQNLDVAERANLSSDGTNSPHSNIYSLQKEKNKARKLVTNQSCLNREVQDDNNLLDLIHKIVPADRMNLTNQTTIIQSKTGLNNKNNTENDDKWDVTSVISMCNDDDVSDTYTDEEIFQGNNSQKNTKKNKDNNSKSNPKTLENEVINNAKIYRDCKVIVEKLPNLVHKQVNNKLIDLSNNNVTKNNVKSLVKSFWDTDFESDAECQTAVPQSYVIDNLRKANATLEGTKQDFKNPARYARSQVSKSSAHVPEVPKQINNTIMNNTVESMRKFNTSTLSIRSHRTSNKKKCNETIVKENTSDKQNKIPVDKNKENSKEPNKKTVEKNYSKTAVKSKTEMPKSNLNTCYEKLGIKTPSISHTRDKSPKSKKSETDKRVENPKNNNKTESKSKLKPENKRSTVKNKVEQNLDITKEESNPKTQSINHKNKKDTQNKGPKSKQNSKYDLHNSSIISKKNNLVSRTTKSNLNNTEELVQKSTIGSDRPIRSCRTSSQNKSLAVSRTLHLNNTSDSDVRKLRSRDISLSCIENITIKGPRSKTVNKKKKTYINTRKSDVSFSLGSNTHTPTPKKSLAQNKANFFKGKRKT